MKERLAAGMQAPDFRFDSPWEQSLDFHKAIDGTGAVLYFLRYMGCPICQYKISEIMRDWDKLRASGKKVFIVLQSEPAIVKEHIGSEEISFAIICDPREEAFRLYGVAPGNILHYIAPSVIIKAVKAARKGFSHGKKEGKEMQRPAVFIIDGKKKITYAYYGKNIGDLPENEEILKRLKLK